MTTMKVVHGCLNAPTAERLEKERLGKACSTSYYCSKGSTRPNRDKEILLKPKSSWETTGLVDRRIWSTIALELIVNEMADWLVVAIMPIIETIQLLIAQ